MTASFARSTSPVGSSASSTGGSFASATASPALAASPPDSVEGLADARSAEADRREELVRSGPASRHRPIAWAARTFCSTVRCSSRLPDCASTPIHRAGGRHGRLRVVA